MTNAKTGGMASDKTLLDEFAGKTLMGFLSRPMAQGDQVADEVNRNPKRCAEWAYEQAEAMIAEKHRREVNHE